MLADLQGVVGSGDDHGVKPDGRSVHDLLAGWLEELHLSGVLRGMTWDELVAGAFGAFAVKVHAGEIFDALMEAGARRERRAAAARLSDIPTCAADEPLFTLAPIGDDGLMIHEDDGGTD